MLIEAVEVAAATYAPTCMRLKRSHKILAVLCCGVLVGCESKHATDDKLIARFQKQKAIFEKLREMIASDSGLQRVDYYWTDPKDPTTLGVSPRRIAEYRNLLDSVGCHRGFSAYGRPEVYFIASARGLGIGGGSEKGFCYLPTPPASVVTNTAIFQATRPETHSIYRHLEGAWYLYFQYDG